MTLQERQHELDIMKWYDSVSKRDDMCGEYIFCDKCNTFFYVCNKATISKGNVTEQNYFDHEDRSLNRKAYFLVSCMTYEDDYLEFHLGEHSYAEFKCPHCGAYAAVKTTSKSYKYMPPKYIMKGRYRNRIC